MATFQKSQTIVGINEGGYQCDPRDTGNYYQGNLIGTNWGISAPTLAGYLGRIPTKEEMVKLSKQTAEHILEVNYWDKNNFDLISNQSLATMLYDGVVNHGTNGMRFLVEKALRSLNYQMSYYEVFTLKGIKVLNSINSKQLFYAVKNARKDKYLSSSQKHYIKGWLKRLERIKYYSDTSISGIWPYTAMSVVGLGIILLTI